MSYQGKTLIQDDAFFRHVICLTANMHYIVLFLKKNTARSLSQWSPLEICHILHQGNDISLIQYHKGTWVVTISNIILDMIPHTNLSSKFLFLRNKHFGKLVFINCYFTKLYIYTDIICQSLCSLNSIQLSPELLHRTLNFPLWQFQPYFS